MLILTNEDVACEQGGSGEQATTTDHVATTDNADTGNHLGKVHRMVIEGHVANGHHVDAADNVGADAQFGGVHHVRGASHGDAGAQVAIIAHKVNGGNVVSCDGPVAGDELGCSDDQDGACDDVDDGDQGGTGDPVSSDQNTESKLGIVDSAVGAPPGGILPPTHLTPGSSDPNPGIVSSDMHIANYVLTATLDFQRVSLVKGDFYLRVGSVQMPLILPVKCGVATGHLHVPLLLLGRSFGVKLNRDKTAFYRCIMYRNKNVRFNVFLEASGTEGHWRDAHTLVYVDTTLLPLDILEEHNLEPGLDITLEEWYDHFPVTLRRLSQQFATWYLTCPWLKALCDGLLKVKIPASWPVTGQPVRGPVVAAARAPKLKSNPMNNGATDAADVPASSPCLTAEGERAAGEQLTGTTRAQTPGGAGEEAHGSGPQAGLGSGSVGPQIYVVPKSAGAKRSREEAGDGHVPPGAGDEARKVHITSRRGWVAGQKSQYLGAVLRERWQIKGQPVDLKMKSLGNGQRASGTAYQTCDQVGAKCMQGFNAQQLRVRRVEHVSPRGLHQQEQQAGKPVDGVVGSCVQRQIEQVVSVELDKRFCQLDKMQWRPPHHVEQQVLQWLQQLQQQVETRAEFKVGQLQKDVEHRLESFVETQTSVCRTLESYVDQKVAAVLATQLEAHLQPIQQQLQTLKQQLAVLQQTQQVPLNGEQQQETANQQPQEDSQQPAECLQQMAHQLAGQLMAFAQQTVHSPTQLQQ